MPPAEKGRKGKSRLTASTDYWNAIINGNVDRVDKLIRSENVNVDLAVDEVSGLTSLPLAALSGQHALCQHLLRKHGVDPTSAFLFDDVLEADVDRYERVVDLLTDVRMNSTIPADVMDTVQSALRDLRRQQAEQGTADGDSGVGKSEDGVTGLGTDQRSQQIQSLQRAIEALKSELDRTRTVKTTLEQRSSEQIQKLQQAFDEELERLEKERSDLQAQIAAMQNSSTTDSRQRGLVQSLQEKNKTLDREARDLRLQLAKLERELQMGGGGDRRGSDSSSDTSVEGDEQRSKEREGGALEDGSNADQKPERKRSSRKSKQSKEGSEKRKASVDSKRRSDRDSPEKSGSSDEESTGDESGSHSESDNEDEETGSAGSDDGEDSAAEKTEKVAKEKKPKREKTKVKATEKSKKPKAGKSKSKEDGEDGGSASSDSADSEEAEEPESDPEDKARAKAASARKRMFFQKLENKGLITLQTSDVEDDALWSGSDQFERSDDSSDSTEESDRNEAERSRSRSRQRGRGRGRKKPLSELDPAERRRVLRYRHALKHALQKIEEMERDLHADDEIPEVSGGAGGGSGKDASGRPQVAGKPGAGGAGANMDVRRLQKRMELLEKELKKRTGERDSLQEKFDVLQKKCRELERKGGGMEEVLRDLQERADSGEKAKQELKTVQSELHRLNKDVERLQLAYKEEVQLRKKYFNMVEDMKGKIRVYCRVRPMSNSERSRGDAMICEMIDECSIKIIPKDKEFVFDHVFGPQDSQEAIFEDTKYLIQSALDGYNVCVFAYGQTGSGKTFTIAGEPNAPGLVPRTMKEIFDLVHKQRAFMRVDIKCYMFELYNDRLYDLFAKRKGTGVFGVGAGGGSAPNAPNATSGGILPDDTKYEIKKDLKGMVYITNAEIKTVTSLGDLVEVYNAGVENRHTRSTAMNASSSRSHLVFAILLESTNLQTQAKACGKLSLVDLAGSERQSKTGLTDMSALEEAKSINLSLTALGNVIAALSTPSTSGKPQHIPYRDNKLTQLMSDSLGGNAKTLMFVNISPTDYNMAESLISLGYATRVKMITNDASKAIESREVQRLKNIIRKLKSVCPPQLIAQAMMADDEESGVDTDTGAESADI